MPRSAVLAAALIPAILSLPACKSPAERADELALQAEGLAGAGDLVAARRTIAEAIALREDNPKYYELLGAISLRSGDPMAAYRAFSRVLEFDGSNKMALAYVANIGVQTGQVKEAEDAADKLLAIEPNAMPALQVKGMIALSRDKFEDAGKIGDRMLAAKPGDEAGTIIKARAMAKAGQAEEALQMLDSTMLASSTPSAALLTNKLNLYRYLRQPEQMAVMLDQLLPLSNGAVSVRLDHINILYRLGKADEARKSALELLANGSNKPEDYRAVQRLWWEFDKTPIPLNLADTSRWKDPLSIVSTVRYFMTRGDLATAGALLRTAPAKAQPLVASLKTRLLAASGKLDEARQQVDALLAKDDHDVDALLLRAQLALRNKQPELAVEAAQVAQTNDPLDPETYIVLAEIFRAQKADWRVRQVYEDGLKNLPQNFFLLEKYTQYLHETGDRGRAVSVVRAFARTSPSSPRAWSLLASQCEWANDRSCLQYALAGRSNAETTFLVDDPPGTPQNRGIFGRI